jgi:hypothetical protein
MSDIVIASGLPIINELSIKQAINSFVFSYISCTHVLIMRVRVGIILPITKISVVLLRRLDKLYVPAFPKSTLSYERPRTKGSLKDR